MTAKGAMSIPFPCGFPKRIFRNEKPPKETRKGTFEGQVVAGTGLEPVTFGL
jgi:hypothetical protein